MEVLAAERLQLGRTPQSASFPRGAVFLQWSVSRDQNQRGVLGKSPDLPLQELGAHRNCGPASAWGSVGLRIGGSGSREPPCLPPADRGHRSAGSPRGPRVAQAHAWRVSWGQGSRVGCGFGLEVKRGSELPSEVGQTGKKQDQPPALRRRTASRWAAGRAAAQTGWWGTSPTRTSVGAGLGLAGKGLPSSPGMYAPGDGDGQGGLACCRPRGHKESDMAEPLNNKQ